MVLFSECGFEEFIGLQMLLKCFIVISAKSLYVAEGIDYIPRSEGISIIFRRLGERVALEAGGIIPICDRGRKDLICFFKFPLKIIAGCHISGLNLLLVNNGR